MTEQNPTPKRLYADLSNKDLGERLLFLGRSVSEASQRLVDDGNELARIAHEIGYREGCAQKLAERSK